MSSDGSRPLDQLVTLRRGITYKSALLDRDGPVLLGLSSIARNGGFRRDSLRTYGGESPPEITLHSGDLYVSLKDVTQSADLLGSAARVPRDIPAGRLTQDTVKLSLRDGYTDYADYLYWLLRTPQYREYCRVHAIGVTTLALPREDFLAFPVPPLTRARAALLRLLSALDDKVEHNGKVAQTLDRIAQQLFVTASRGENVVTVEDVAAINASSHSARSHPQEIEYIDISSVAPRQLLETNRLFYDHAPSRARRIVEPGDTLVSTVRPERRAMLFVARAFEQLTASTGFAVVSPHDVAPTFLYRAITSDRCIDHLAAAASGSAYPSVNPKVLAAWEFAMPIDRGTGYERMARPLEDLRWHIFHESRRLADLRDALLPKLVSGVIRFPDSYHPAGAAAEAAGVAGP